MIQQLDLLATQPGVSAVGWQFEPTLTQEQWIADGRLMARLETSRQWLLGDWWNAGVQWGEGQAVCEAVGIAYQTAMNCGSIAAHFHFSRRQENLTFSHHTEVCPIDDPAVQDRFLAWALEPYETTGKPRSTRDLRAAIRQYLDEHGWTPFERARRQAVEEGFTTLAHLKNDPHLVQWAHFTGKLVKIDRTTKWGNPFEVGKDGDRDYVIESFAEHYFPRKRSLCDATHELKGAVLGCWCVPEPCHGEALLEAADRMGYERYLDLLESEGICHAAP